MYHQFLKNERLDVVLVLICISVDIVPVKQMS